MSKEKCPACGEEFDTSEHEVVECPMCGKQGATACCCPGGKNCSCAECEEEGNGDEDDPVDVMHDDDGFAD